MTNIRTDGPFNEFPRATDLVRYEVSDYSREVGVVQAGNEYESGTVIAKVGSYVVPFDPTASDGSENPIGVLLYRVAQSTKDIGQVYLARHAVVGVGGLIWGANVTTQAQKDAAIATLTAAGILVRGSV